MGVRLMEMTPSVVNDVPGIRHPELGHVVGQQGLGEIRVVQRLPGALLNLASGGVHNLSRQRRKRAIGAGLHVGLFHHTVGRLLNRGGPVKHHHFPAAGNGAGLALLGFALFEGPNATTPAS